MADKKNDDLGADEVQKAVDEENEQGFLGTEVDPTPNENYTVAGVTSGKPTPETDEKAAAKARESAGLR
ncbi:MAG: hypothetical protein LC798_08355 [Chloroflexi bacterium]|nr:hypothetical protein [Chloroflexota bacterium]